MLFIKIENILVKRYMLRGLVAFHEHCEVHSLALITDRKLARLFTLQESRGRLHNRIVNLIHISQVEFPQMLQLSDRLDYTFKTKQQTYIRWFVK